MTERKQNIAEGAMILAASIIIVKVVGLIYKFPLIDALKGGGWGYYTTAYNIFGAIYAVAVTGFPTAVSRLVSEAHSEGRYNDCVRIRRDAIRLFAWIGVAACAGLMLLARWLVDDVMEDPDAYLCVLAIAPSLICSCIMSAHRGYYQGMADMVPSAISEIVEVVVKAALSYGAAVMINHYLSYEYDTYGTVLGIARTESTVTSAILSVSAAGAIFGVTLSTLAGWLCMKIIYRNRGCAISDEMLAEAPPARDDRELTKEVLRFGLPIALSALALRITSLIDNATVIRCLNDVIETDLPELYASHNGLFELIDVEVKDLANYLYEVYGYGMPFFDLVPTLTATFSTSALPHITAAFNRGENVEVKKNIETTLSIVMLLAAPAGFGIAFMAQPILNLVYPSMEVGAALCAPMLTVLGVAAIFSCLTGALNTMLQAIGRVDIPVKIMIAGSAVKIITNKMLVSVPSYNIKAAPAGNLICFMITAMLGLILLVHYSGVKINLGRTMLKPLAGGALTGFIARLIYNLMSPVFGVRIPALIGILVAVVFYAAVVLVFRFLSKEEMEMIPGLRKLVPVLEKLHLVR